MNFKTKYKTLQIQIKTTLIRQNFSLDLIFIIEITMTRILNIKQKLKKNNICEIKS